MSAAAIATILDRSVDLLDPFAIEQGPNEPPPIYWGPEFTNGISLVPPDGWREGDPPYWAEEHCDVVAASAEPAVPELRKTLLDHLGDVDAIYQTLEGLDDEELDDAAREELGRMLGESIAGSKTKIDSSHSVRAALEAAEAASKAEEKRHGARHKRFRRQIERLDAYLMHVMMLRDEKKLEGFSTTIKLATNPPKLQIDDASLIPDTFLVIPEPVAPYPDNDAIKAALKAQIPVGGCRLTRGQRVVWS